ncbi:pentapeptide repeat-containing protein [Cellulomonas rhizosphaerae]|uniref:Pentapeptide repeat-containing protein n=1 Tax=Cellulomonas rhizosphaerae TaxID=2293719 RepID=A0A413RR35_9CELL|nr:pentapeptide repeat-containing protein [Cellulomonas rhizosphaerae]RHA44404.1 pentapeptide repeat-containing protein [Cellulomonas rhizosphaerae]
MLSRPSDDSWAAWFSDLRYGARLRDIDLTSADLISVRTPRLAWFTRCLFVGADLRQSTLDGVVFLRCDFSRADLRGASLRGTRFFGCDLTRADLRGADLRGAVFGTSGPAGSATPTILTGARTDPRDWAAVSDESDVWPDRS